VKRRKKIMMNYSQNRKTTKNTGGFVMKQILMAVSILAASAVFLMTWGCGVSFASEGQGQKILIAYFSWSGNTREIAGQIHARVGGDLFEIEVVNPYPSEYRACTEAAKKEQENDARPALSTRVENMDSYDVVFIGYPSWWSTIPMALFTFFEQYDFSGKTIVPFCTHGGSRLGRSVQDITRLCPQSTIFDGLAIRGSSVKTAQNDVAAWLRKLGMVD
jgi:flavodoxin